MSAHFVRVIHYWPISYCVVFYKVIAKVLVGRLASMIEDILDPAQVAFVWGLSIIENIHLAQEIFKEKEMSTIYLKVDLQKAFDFIYWGFLQDEMISVGFPQWLTWILECVGMTTYSIVFNGGMYDHFQGAQGLPQGDRLSSYLFGLCLEIILHALRQAIARLDFHFHSKCAAMGITYLTYANELLLFVRVEVSSTSVLVECL